MVFEELPSAFSAIQFMPTVMPRSALPVTSCFSLKSCAAFAASAAAFLAFSLMWCSRSSAAALSPIATVALPVACATWPTSSLRVAAYAAAPAATSPANGPTNASPTTPPATAAPPSTLLLVVAAAASCEFVCRCESGGGGGIGRFIFTLPSLHPGGAAAAARSAAATRSAAAASLRASRARSAEMIRVPLGCLLLLFLPCFFRFLTLAAAADAPAPHLPDGAVCGTLLLIDPFDASFSRRPITAVNVSMSSSVAVPAVSFDTSCAFMARSVTRSAMHK